MKVSCILGTIVLLVGSAIPACAQAAVEAGLGASRAATMSAPAKTTGGAISNLFGQAAKALEAVGISTGLTHPAETASEPVPVPLPAPVPARSARAAKAKATPARVAVLHTVPAKPKAIYEDPGTILIGTEYEEVVRRFGPPTLAITTQVGVQTLRYQSAGAPVKVQMRGGKVAAVDAPSADRL
jgi:hypothetical protein